VSSHPSRQQNGGSASVSRNFGLPRKKLLDRQALETECLRVLRSLHGYSVLERVEVRPSLRSRRGGNWKIARVFPDVLHPGPKQWAAFRDSVEELMARFELAAETCDEELEPR
jgi:hypothetical protein